MVVALFANSVIAPITAKTIPLAISAYSIAVAPTSSEKNSFMVFTCPPVVD